MQIVYAAHIPIVVPVGDVDSPSPEESFKQTINSWTGRFGIAIQDWESGEADSPRAHAEWESLAGTAGRLIRVVLTHPDPNSPLNWRTTIWFGVADSDTWLRASVALEPRVEGIVVDPRISVGAPRFVGELAELFNLTIDGRAVGSWWKVSPAEVPDYLRFLASDERRLPIVAITRPSNGQSPVAPEPLTRRLSGIAHVVAIEPAATYAISDAVAPVRSVFGGAVRVYWPGFNEQSPPQSHPLFMPRGAYLGSEAFLDDLASRLGRSAGLFLGPPGLEGELRRERILQGAEEARRTQEERLKRQAEVKERAAGGLTAEEFDAFSKDYDAETKRREQLEELVVELRLKLDAEREQRISQENAHRDAWLSLATGAEMDSVESETSDESNRVPESIREAVEIAATRCPDLVFTQSAYESAEESQFSSPADVLADLLLLQDVASSWVAGTMTGDFRHAFEGRHSNFKSGISQIAETKYGVDYTVSYGGRYVQMGPHLCRGGTGAASTIMRIYWFKDDENKKLVVGHVGKHLRDDGYSG